MHVGFALAAACSMLLANAVGAPAIARAQGECSSWDVTDGWSDSANPNGPWSYNEGDNPLPHIDAWEQATGAWSTSQPGWARSENDTNRIPFWFLHNGAATFPVDLLAGDTAVHTTDGSNGIGNGSAILTWTSPIDGVVTVTGAIWIARDIGRSNDWILYQNDQELTRGNVASGDPYSRDSPFDLAAGTGGPDPLTAIPVTVGDGLRLELVRTSQFGDFCGIQLTVSCIGLTSTTTTTLPPVGVCGDPVSPPTARRPSLVNATDALAVLSTAVGLRTCPLCVCEVDDSGSVVATDALIVLRFAVGQSVTLNCPTC